MEFSWLRRFETGTLYRVTYDMLLYHDLEDRSTSKTSVLVPNDLVTYLGESIKGFSTTRYYLFVTPRGVGYLSYVRGSINKMRKVKGLPEV